MRIIAIFIILTSSLTFSQIQRIIADLPSEQAPERVTPLLSPQPEQKKSLGLAILYSALLPGMGEYYAGDYSLGRYFTIADAGFFLTYAGVQTYSKWQTDNYKAFAKSKGGVSGNFDDDYFANIGAYMSIANYNDDMSFQRRFSEMYAPERFWEWTTQGDRKTYRGMWTSAQEANNNLRFVVGALIVNRIVSIINAVRVVSARDKSLPQTSYGFILNPPLTSGNGMSAVFYLNF